MLSVERGKLVRRCYWQWRYPPERDVEAPPYARVCEELRQRLVDSVRLQLRADVPVGAYLSGGLDSSAVAALIRRYTGAPLMVLSGLVSIVFGIVIAAQPASGLLAVAWLIGIYAIVFGILHLVAYFEARSVVSSLAGPQH